MEVSERLRALEAENRLLREGLAAIVNVCGGGDGGGDAPPDRTRGIVSADNDVAASTQSPPSSLFALGVDVCVFVFSCLCVFRETPLTLPAAQIGRWIADPS